MIATGLEEGVSGDWEGLTCAMWRYPAATRAIYRARDLEALASELAAFAAEIQNALENHVKLQKISANEFQNGRHIQNQITNSFDLEPSLQQGRGETLEPNDQGSPPPSANANSKPSASRTYPLGMVLEACPDIVDYAKGGINNWRDLATTAALVRSALGGVAGRLGAGLGGYGRTRRVNRHRRDPATRRGDQKRRRLFAGSDGQSQGGRVFARARADGAAAG